MVFCQRLPEGNMAGKSPKNPSEDGVFHHHPWPPWTRKKTPKNHGKSPFFFLWENDGKTMGKW